MKQTRLVLFLFALTVSATINAVFAQSCNPAVVHYIVRDGSGKILNEAELKAIAAQLPPSIGDTQISVGEVSFAADGKSFYWPESTDWNSGKKVPALVFANAATCTLHLTEVMLTHRNQRMRLRFNLEITRTQPDRRPVIDALPFRHGVVALDLSNWARNEHEMIPAARWKWSHGKADRASRSRLN